MSMVGHIVFYYIPSAWASALLILDQGQCESLYTRDKQSSRFPRSFYMLPLTQLSLQRQGNRAGKKLRPTRIRVHIYEETLLMEVLIPNEKGYF